MSQINIWREPEPGKYASVNRRRRGGAIYYYQWTVSGPHGGERGEEETHGAAVAAMEDAKRRLW